MANGMLMPVYAGIIEMMDWTDYKYTFFFLLFELCDDEMRIWSKYYRISFKYNLYMKVYALRYLWIDIFSISSLGK